MYATGILNPVLFSIFSGISNQLVDMCTFPDWLLSFVTAVWLYVVEFWQLKEQHSSNNMYSSRIKCKPIVFWWLSLLTSSPLAAYNSLQDKHLAGYFSNSRMKKHLRKSGLVRFITYIVACGKKEGLVWLVKQFSILWLSTFCEVENKMGISKQTCMLVWHFDFIKPWPNGPASTRKWTQVELAKRLALSGQTDSQVSLQVHASRKKIILRWRPNSKKLALTCVQIWSQPKWVQVIACQGKYT